MSDTDRDLLIAEFQNITGCDTERAQFYLESAGMKLDLAITSFYENDGEVEPSEVSPPEGAAGTPAAVGGEPAKAPAAGRLGIIDGDSDSEEEGQAFYAGGSSSSGNVILGPSKNKKRDIVADVFKKAKEAGAEQVEASGAEATPGSSKTKAFSGGGFTLGDESTPSLKLGGSSPSASKKQQRNFVLKMWQNGFSLDDGDLRSYDEPGNREFLASIMRGKIPSELVREAEGGEVHLDMEDHRNEEFVKPKVKAKPFVGAGQVLGSIAPQTVETPVASGGSPAEAEAKAAADLAVDNSQPITSIQVRLADGSRLVVRMNHTHTIGHIRAFIQTARPQYAGKPFAIMTSFPPAELTDDAQSVQAAGILNSAVMQRLK